MVVRLISCSPRRRIRLVTVIGELAVLPNPGCQDHTALPSASVPFVCALSNRSQVAKPALRSPRAPDAAASTAFHPDVRDDHDTPLCGGWNGGISKADLGQARREIFLQTGLDANLVICPAGSFTCRARRSRPCTRSSMTDGEPRTVIMVKARSAVGENRQLSFRAIQKLAARNKTILAGNNPLWRSSKFRPFSKSFAAPGSSVRFPSAELANQAAAWAEYQIDNAPHATPMA